MKVRYLDLETGRTAIDERSTTQFELEEGNWSCDCNRKGAFGDYDVGARHCSGCRRFIVVEVFPEDGESLNCEDIVREANREYYMRLSGEVA